MAHDSVPPSVVSPRVKWSQGGNYSTTFLLEREFSACLGLFV